MIMRQGLLWLSERQGIFNFVRRNGVARKFASRFVAGETTDTGVQAAVDLAAKGITSSLDLLGESVTAESEAVAARDQYLQMLDRMAAAKVEVNGAFKIAPTIAHGVPVMSIGFFLDPEQAVIWRGPMLS